MPTILIVCTGNICRSPMAMALLRRKFEQENMQDTWRVESAGTWTREGYPAAENGIKLMADLGMDIAGHRSREVTGAVLETADLVLTMERNHKEALRAEFQDHANRIYMLSEMIGEQLDIYDPIGGPIDEFKETVQEINALLINGFDQMVSLARENARR